MPLYPYHKTGLTLATDRYSLCFGWQWPELVTVDDYGLCNPCLCHQPPEQELVPLLAPCVPGHCPPDLE